MKTKNILIPTLVILISTLLISVFPTEKEYAIYNDTVRLHILASSDSKEDQELKIQIRDRLLSKYSAILSGYQSKEEAERELRKSLDVINQDVSRWISDKGYSYSSSVYLGQEWYDTRSYGEYTLPEGYYTSLIVSIGEGKGQNWWCVMYPPLCLGVAIDGEDLTEEEYALIKKGQCSYKFKILELLSREFRDKS